MAKKLTEGKMRGGVKTGSSQNPTGAPPAPQPKNKGGRPKLFTDPKDIEKIAIEYFKKCDERKVPTLVGSEIVNAPNPEPYTMSGLAYELKMDRDSLLNYSKDEKFFRTIKRFRDKVQSDVERRRIEGKNCTGAIFNLKNNFGWKDKTEQEINGGLSVGTYKTTAEQARKQADELDNELDDV